jgi:hypothetical protein
MLGFDFKCNILENVSKLKSDFVYSDQSISCLRSTIATSNVLNSDYRGYMDHGGGGGVGDTVNRKEEYLFIDSLSSETIDRARTYTFTNWPTITPSTQEMTIAGWWYTNIADRVICIHCDTMFHNWSETDRPYDIHRLKSPRCLFVRTTEKKAATSQRLVPVANATINDVPNGQTIVGAVHADYSLVCRRHQTFQNWPEAERSSLPSIESFVDAGFFYTGLNHFE